MIVPFSDLDTWPDWMQTIAYSLGDWCVSWHCVLL